MARIMYNCREVTQMISESLDRQMSFSQRIGIRVHLLMCKLCSRYQRQLLFLRKIIGLHVAAGEDAESAIELPSATRERMKQSIRDALESYE